MTQYSVYEDGDQFEASVRAADVDTALAHARKVFGPSIRRRILEVFPTTTTFVRLAVSGAGEARHTWLTIHPVAPACTSGRHAWSDGESWGHGGGVQIVRTCRKCGCEHVEDTWGETPTGEQGYRTHTYQGV